MANGKRVRGFAFGAILVDWRIDMKVFRGTCTAVVFCGCCVGIPFAQKANPDTAAKTTPVAVSADIKSPRDAASGLPTGKQKNAPAPYAFQDGVTAKPAPAPATVPCTGPACAPTTQEHAINTKGTGATANARITPATQGHAISEKGTGTAGITAAETNGTVNPAHSAPAPTVQEHAISTKGTGSNNGNNPKPTPTPVNENDPCHTPTGCPPH